MTINKASYILCAGAALLAVQSCSDTSDEKMNIIFILTDDQRFDALGFSGNEIIHTPEMDKLARNGAFFRNAFITSPVCTASRASIFTGMYERLHGFTFGQDSINEVFMSTSYPRLMMDSEYYTGFYGKFGVKYEPLDRLFHDFESYDRNNSASDRRGFFYKTFGEDTVHLTKYTGERALEFIRNAPADRPFCLSISFSAPHAHDSAPDQYFWQDEVDRLYKDIIIPPPVCADDSIYQKLPEYVKEGLNRTRWTWRFDTPEKYQNSVKGYYRMISGVDIEIGRIRRLLEEMNMDKKTIIIFMGDNGYFLGEKQLAGKWLMYDLSLRVPLIIYDPRSTNPMIIEQMVLNVDIPSTILDLAGLKPSEAWQGKSLVPWVNADAKGNLREEFLCEHLWDYELIPPSEGVRTREWKYFRYINDPDHEELYNLENDPDEIINLAENEKYNSVLLGLRSKCDSLIEINRNGTR